MQKLRPIIPVLALFVSLSCFAETCPPVDSVDLDNPPPGWSVAVPRIMDGDYHFSRAVHSLNATFFYQQVFCVYATCESPGCLAFSLLSDDTYTDPAVKTPPWDARPSVSYTLACAPVSHDPNICVFS